MLVSKTINSNHGVYVIVNDYTPPHISNNSTEHDGFVRVNSGRFEYYDPSCACWFQITESNLTIDLDQSIMQVVEWAQKKMNEEKLLIEAEKTIPALKTARERYEIIKHLVITERN